MREKESFNNRKVSKMTEERLTGMGFFHWGIFVVALCLFFPYFMYYAWFRDTI